MSNTVTYDDNWLNVKITRGLESQTILEITKKPPMGSTSSKDQVMKLTGDGVIRLRDFLVQNI